MVILSENIEFTQEGPKKMIVFCLLKFKSSGGDSWLFNLKLPPLSAIIFSLLLKITNIQS